MIWERDPLWAKAKLFFERAFDKSDDELEFGLWCSFGLELLARAAVASVSSTLLAESDREHKNLLHALGFGQKLLSPKSINAAQLFLLCKGLFDAFTEEDVKASMALINRRNAELHSAEAAFDSYPSKQWLPGFYHACSSLVKALNETLDSLLGPGQADAATQVVQQSRKDVAGTVKASIAAYRKVFDDRSKAERQTAVDAAKADIAKLVYERHHKVPCPACGSDAAVEGDPIGSEKLDHKDGDIVVRQRVMPRLFRCSACGLKLTGYEELQAAELGGFYTRKTTLSPEDYYGLIDPETADLSEYVDRYLADAAEEYDNE